jgi:hypothetical protein
MGTRALLFARRRHAYVATKASAMHTKAASMAMQHQVRLKGTLGCMSEEAEDLLLRRSGRDMGHVNREKRGVCKPGCG